MAELVNTHIEAIRNSFESEVASLLLKLPDNWMIWHEPVVGERLTPDFIIFVTFSNRLALFILEVKDWLDKYIEFNDEHNTVQLRGRPPEEEPIHKLIRVENIFIDRLRGLNRLNPIFKDIPVISYLGFKQRIEEINRHFIDDGRIKVFPEIGNNLKKFKRELEQFTLEKNFIFNYKINDLKEVRNNVCLKSAVPLPSNLINQKDIKLRKQIGFLDDKQRRTVENRDLGHLRLSGFPGTGKTIVLLARLSWYARRFPEKNYLFVVTQATLRTNIEQKYWAYFANEGDSKKKISFVRFEDWLKDSTEGIKQELLNNPFKRKNEIILNYCKGLLNGTKVFKDSDKSAYGYIFVDEAHQMFPEWINVLTMCAEKDKDKRNIWIAADNGQCIYQKRKFDEGSINLNFQGRGVIFNRIYRSGLYPWLFAACCHPKSLRATSHVGHINEIEFLKLADGPKKIQKNSYKLQAEELKFYINKMNAKGKINWGDVTLFYAVKGMNDHLPYDETVYNVLNEVFKECGDGGVEWLSFDHEKTNYKKNRVRACTFTSSQGLDSKTSVLFGAENFQLFSDDSWVDPDALFYTVLTRAVDNIILTYQNLESVDDRYKIMLKNGLLRFNHLKKLDKYNSDFYLYEQKKDQLGNVYYVLNWDRIRRFINAIEVQSIPIKENNYQDGESAKERSKKISFITDNSKKKKDTKKIIKISNDKNKLTKVFDNKKIDSNQINKIYDQPMKVYMLSRELNIPTKELKHKLELIGVKQANNFQMLSTHQIKRIIDLI